MNRGPRPATLWGMATKQPSRTARRPLVRSIGLLKIVAAGITLLSLAGTTVYASDHLYSASAPLRPQAVGAATPAAGAKTTTSSTSGRLNLSPTVTTTAAPAITGTHHS